MTRVAEEHADSALIHRRHRRRAWLLRSYLAAECLVAYVVFPALVDLGKHGPLLIPFLVVAGVLVLVYLLNDRSFNRSCLWNFGGLIRVFPRMLVTWMIGIIAMIGTVMWIERQPWAPEQITLFGFLERAPTVWLVIMVLYPLFSVYPQELILRTFFFHRYKPLFRHPAAMIIANGLIFAWVHVMFQNWPAVLLCIPAGILFAYTYWRSKSTLASGLEHAMFGDAMWTIGLGWFFYAGSVGAGG